MEPQIVVVKYLDKKIRVLRERFLSVTSFGVLSLELHFIIKSHIPRQHVIKVISNICISKAFPISNFVN